jgi:hypothetical protein
MGYAGGMDEEALKKYASEFARLGGLSKSPARAKASRENGKRGGRPKKAKTAAQTKAKKSN